MEFEEMNQRAYDRKPEPDGLTPAERMIWLALRLLYELHFHGGLTREEGVAYKQELQRDYERNLAQEAEWLRAGTAMKLLRQSENPEVKKIVGESVTPARRTPPSGSSGSGTGTTYRADRKKRRNRRNEN